MSSHFPRKQQRQRLQYLNETTPRPLEILMLTTKRTVLLFVVGTLLSALASTEAFTWAPSTPVTFQRSSNIRPRTTSSRLSVSIPLLDEDDSNSNTKNNNNKNDQLQKRVLTTTPSSSSIVSPIAPGSAAFPKVGILLLNLGGPEKLDDVEGMYT